MFFESTELSFNSNTSCSTCHLDEFSSADGLPIAIGIEGHGKGRERAMGGGSIVPRNTLALWGRAARQFDTFFWDGKVQKTENGIVSQFGDQVPSDDPLIVAVSLPFVEIREMVSDDQYVQEKLMTETVSSRLKLFNGSSLQELWMFWVRGMKSKKRLALMVPM